MKPNVARDMKIATVVQARMTIERRVNELGVAEPIIAQQGTEQDHLLVQLPGVTDVDRAKAVIQSTAQLELKLVEQGPAPTRESLLQASGGKEPPGTEVLPGVQDRAQAGAATAQTVYYLVRKVPILTGRDLRSAKQGPDQFNQPAVHFEVKGDAATRFGKATRENINRLLAIVLDGTIVSAPNIEGAHQRPGPDLRDVHDAGGRGPGAEAPVRRAAGSADLHAGARRSARRSARTRSTRASWRR